MNTTLILIIIGVIAVIAILGFIVKSIVKMILMLGVIYLLFNIGFLWGGHDLVTKLHLDKVLKPEVTQKIQQTYNDFSQKRDANGVIESDLVKKTVNDSLQVSLTKASNQIGNVDKQALIRDLSSKLQNFDTQAVAKALDDLKAELAKYNVTPQEVQTAIQTTKS